MKKEAKGKVKGAVAMREKEGRKEVEEGAENGKKIAKELEIPIMLYTSYVWIQKKMIY